jgi:hypothetical protein
LHRPCRGGRAILGGGLALPPFELEKSLSVRVAFDVEPGVLARLHLDPVAFTREFRIAAAVAWYERQLVSQGRAAEIAGLSRAEFIDALGRYGVSPFQDTFDELVAASRLPAHG